jgi:hypothetical protein
LRIAAAVSNARPVSDSFVGLSVIMELVEAIPIIGRLVPARTPPGATRSGQGKCQGPSRVFAFVEGGVDHLAQAL